MVRQVLIAIVVAALLCVPCPAQQSYIFITGASHIDLAWKWRWQEALDTCIETYTSVLDLMDEYEAIYGERSPVFYAQSNAHSYMWMESCCPDLFERIRKRVADGRWELVGGMWVESNTNVVGGESLVRQFVFGQRYFQQRFGTRPHIGWLPDSFGYSAGLPKIMSRAGISHFVYFKTHWNDTHKPELFFFRWRGDDSSSVNAHLLLGHYNQKPRARLMTKQLEQLAETHPGVPALLYLMGVGDHGGGVPREMWEQALSLRDEGYPILFGVPSSFFDMVGDSAFGHEVAGELYLELHRGTYTTRLKLKELLDRVEAALIEAETACALAKLEGYSGCRDELNELWTHLLFNQFHDIAAGTCIEDVYELDTYPELESTLDQALALRDRAVADLLSEVDAGGAGTPVALFNLAGFSYSGPVELDVPAGLGVVDSSGEAVPWQYSHADGRLLFWADVPPMGYRVYFLTGSAPQPSADDTGLYAQGSVMRNRYLRVELDRETGYLKSLVELSSGHEFVQPGGLGNDLQLYKEDSILQEAWNLYYNKYKQEPYGAGDPRRFELVESGPLRALVEVERVGEFGFVQRYELYAFSPWLVMRTDVLGWGEPAHRLLKVSFPINVENPSCTATYEVPYSVLKRDHSGAVAYKEVPVTGWGEIGNGSVGMALMAPHRHGMDILNDGPPRGLSDGRCNILRLTLARSPTSPLNEFLDFLGPVTDVGDFSAVYAVYPHAGDWRDADVWRAARLIDRAPVIYWLGSHGGKRSARKQLVSLDADSLLITAFKEADASEDEYIVRLWEVEGRAGVFRLAFPDFEVESVRTVNLLEEDVSDGRYIEVSGGAVVGEYKPNEILTLALSFKAKGEAESASGGGCGCAY